MTAPMVLRVARLLDRHAFSARDTSAHDAAYWAGKRKRATDLARSIFETIRDPTLDMALSAQELAIWRAMIDKALDE